MHREYHKWFSPHLQRDMELLIFGYDGARVLVFPTRCGKFYDYENFGLVEASREWIERGWLQLYCIDSIDQESFYCNWCRREDRIKRHVQFEEYILKEVLPLSEYKNPRSLLVSHGCSLGAYHAVNIALRHPQLFGKVLALSGRYDLTTRCGDFRDLFDGYVDQTIYFHMPLMYLPNITDKESLNSLRRLKITLVVGDQDPFLESNRQLSWVLHEKDISHSLHLWPGRAHRADYWTKMIHLYL
jgi:esterase/lipase superfamily enzyme